MTQTDERKMTGRDVSVLDRGATTLNTDYIHTIGDSELLIRNTFDTDPRLGCELLYRRYYGSLCSHAVRFLSSRVAAEDLVAEIFCQLYAEDVFRTITTSYRAYLYQTVRHRSFNYLRQVRFREVGLEEVQGFSIADVQLPDAITQFDELSRDVEKAIRTLPQQRRKIYVMNRFEGQKYAEIATELGLSVRTVEVQIRQASHHLRNLLADKWTKLTF